ncbi:MAG: hypothetical protein HY678_10540 [Chloroflexi bacterium]|nr:hypothetical protein [Chloroflexota bacterium]
MKQAARFDPERARASLSRLMEIYRDIAIRADQVSTYRCPYKNARARCTAEFKCRNQHFTRIPGDAPVCTGSDKLDYRSAWETGTPVGT